ncbi:MAG: hypothetical protein M1825_001388 [Sarcosagium campestre]|nr:MAG: hypothetical protein M1825_001388 [Sarcosagium campestre]
MLYCRLMSLLSFASLTLLSAAYKLDDASCMDQEAASVINAALFDVRTMSARAENAVSNLYSQHRVSGLFRQLFQSDSGKGIVIDQLRSLQSIASLGSDDMTIYCNDNIAGMRRRDADMSPEDVEESPYAAPTHGQLCGPDAADWVHVYNQEDIVVCPAALRERAWRFRSIQLVNATPAHQTTDVDGIQTLGTAIFSKVRIMNFFSFMSINSWSRAKTNS